MPKCWLYQWSCFYLLGRLCSARFCILLSKCGFSRMFHTERSWHIYRLTVVIVFWSAGFALWCKRIFFDLFWSVKLFLLRLNKGSNFLQSAFWIWITKRFSLVRECNVFLQCCITLGPARQFSLQNVKLSRIVTYRSKIIRVNCSLNWSYINLLWRIELWLSKLQLSVFLKIVWVFWLERVVPPLVIALNKLNSL